MTGELLDDLNELDYNIISFLWKLIDIDIENKIRSEMNRAFDNNDLRLILDVELINLNKNNSHIN